MNDLFAGLTYFGSVGLLLVLLLAPRTRRRWRLLLAGLVGHVVACGVIFWLMAEWREAGYREWFWGYMYFIPLNLLVGVYYLRVAFVPGRARDRK